MFKSYDKIFEERGEAYHRAMALCPDARKAEFQLAIDAVALQPREVLCDVPAGGGYLVRHLPDDLDVQLITVDPSEVFARTWSGVDIETHLAPLEALPLASDRCDALISIAGLHHVEHRLPVFQELRRVLRPGGRLAILEVAEGSTVDAFLNDFVDGHNSMGHEGRFIDREFRSALHAAGFTVVQDKAVAYPWHFKDEGTMAEFIRLLFGLDLATPEIVLRGIRDYLGYEQDSNGCRMNWELQVVTGI